MCFAACCIAMYYCDNVLQYTCACTYLFNCSNQLQSSFPFIPSLPPSLFPPSLLFCLPLHLPPNLLSLSQNLSASQSDRQTSSSYQPTITMYKVKTLLLKRKPVHRQNRNLTYLVLVWIVLILGHIRGWLVEGRGGGGEHQVLGKL